MSPKRLQHIVACTVASLIVTMASVAINSQRSDVHQTTAALKWARQVATQAEGMVFKAREVGEKDPVSWAVSYLSQGVEPRLVRVSRVQVPDTGSGNPESYEMDRGAGLFNYTRVLTSDNGMGIHIQLVQAYSGFLGAQSPLVSDLLSLAVFAIFFALMFLRTGRYFGFDDARRIRALVSSWAGGAKAQLTRHGGHIREMVRESQRLAVSTGRAREHVGALRTHIHAGLAELHGSRDIYKEGDVIAARAETIALNMAIEANRLGGDARRIAAMATELHRALQSLHAVNAKSQKLLQRIERQVEPWATDADLALNSFEDVRDATTLLGQHIRSTTESLIGQAKLIQALNQDLGAQDASGRIPDKYNPANQLSAPRPASAATTSAWGHPPRLPDPLPPIQDDKEPRLARKIRVLQRKIRHRKSA